MPSPAKTALPDAKRGTIFWIDPFAVTLIGIDSGDSSHPHYDERVHLPPDQQWVNVFMELGCDDPVILTKDQEHGVIVVDGRRRTINARAGNEQLVAAGKPPRMIAAMVSSLDEVDLLKRAIVRNRYRDDETPISLGHKASQLMSEPHNCTEAEVALYLRCSLQSVRNYLSVYRLDDGTKDRFRRGELTVRQLYDLARIPDEQQRDMAAAEASAANIPSSERGGKGARKKNEAQERPTRGMMRFMSEWKPEPESNAKPLPLALRVFMAWLGGEIDLEAACESVPGLKAALLAAKAAAKARKKKAEAAAAKRTATAGTKTAAAATARASGDSHGIKDAPADAPAVLPSKE